MVGRGPYCIDVAHQGPELFMDSTYRGLVNHPRKSVVFENEAVILAKMGSYFKTPPVKIPDKSSNRYQQNSSPKSPPKSRESKGSSESPSSIVSDLLQQNSVNGLYAGAKFSEPPLPTELPKPPSHWVKSSARKNVVEMADSFTGESCAQMTNNLKVLLKVNS